jgi:SAM-dependent methyltransferase
MPREQYLEFARKKSRSEFEWIKERLPAGEGSTLRLTSKGRRVLEIGCATGQLLRYFKDEGWEAVGVEPTRSFAEYGTNVHGVPILPVLFEEAELEPGFDLVILSQVLEHVHDPDAVLRRAASLLLPAGRLYVSVPNYRARLGARPARELFISTHFHIFSAVSLTNLALQCGLAVEMRGTRGIYLRVILRPDPAVVSHVEREGPAIVTCQVWGLALRYFLLHDSRLLVAEWTKRRLRAFLGEAKGEQTIEALRRFKHRLFRTEDCSRV